MRQQRGAVARVGWHGGAALGVAAGVSAVAWVVLPADVRVPIHIGVDGVDRWAGKLEAVLAVPAGMLYVLLVGLAVTARAARRGREEPLAFLAIVGSLWFLVVLHAALLAAPLGSWGPGVLVTLATAGVVLVVLVRRRARARRRTRIGVGLSPGCRAGPGAPGPVRARRGRR